jgi:mono/diheme cytochrome c family protein
MRRTLVPLAVTASLASLLVFVVSPVVRADGDAAKLYKTNCVLCHAADGSGSSPSGKALKAKDLGSSDVQKDTDAQITEALTKGKGKMPAFGAKLKPEDIQQLVAYVRTLAKK